jgi:hypothetical protein
VLYIVITIFKENVEIFKLKIEITTSQLGFMNKTNKTMNLCKELMDAIQTILENCRAKKLGKAREHHTIS